MSYHYSLETIRIATAKITIMNYNQSTTEAEYKSGFISLVGKPNVGKSTLLNCLLGQKVSITANKPQTTRNQVRGILTTDDYQAILVDTPGIHMPENELHRRIVGYATQSLQDTDIVFYLMEPLGDSQVKPGKNDLIVLENLKKIKIPVLLLINKVDLYKKEQVFKTIQLMNELYPFKETIPVSALKQQGIEHLDKIFKTYLEPGPMYYPDAQVTDTPEKVIAAELIREQIFRLCHQEIPYGVAVDLEKFEEQDNMIKIYASIFVERESQKGIIIGKKGSMLKKIGTNAREKIEHLLGIKVFLSLNVKLVKNWSNSNRRLNDLGYTSL